MTKQQKLKDVFYAIGATIISLFLHQLIGRALKSFFANEFVYNLVGEVIFAVCALFFVLLLKRTDVFKSDSKFLRSGLTAAGFFWFLLLLQGWISLPQLVVATAAPWEIVLFIIFGFLVGFTEEVLFRGLVQGALHRYFGEDSFQHVLSAVLVGGIIFGAAHLSNAFRPGANVLSSVVQAAATAGMGVYLGTIYFRSKKNIWFLIILHGVYDLIVMTASGMLSGNQASNILNSYSNNYIGALIWLVVYTLLSLFLLRPKKIEPLLEKE